MNMRYSIDIWIERELDTCRKLHSRFARRLKRFPDVIAGSQLTTTSSKGRKYYSELWTENGTKKKKYLGAGGNKEVLEIKEYRFLRKALKVLENRIKFLEDLRLKIEPVEIEAINDMLPVVYRLSREHLAEVAGPDAATKWYTDAVRVMKRIEERDGIWYEEGRIHAAKDGTLMRSKSEVSIANELIRRGIPYIYEMTVSSRNITIHPDFMFYSHSRGKPMMWEHAGMLGDDTYIRDFTRKMDAYAAGGYVPGVDVILTFDTTDGHLDTRIIDAIIDEYR